jgi:heptaprenyl diphosphate synthase
VSAATERRTALLASVYEPVEAEMRELERWLDEVVETAPSEMEEQLSYALKAGGKRLRPALTLLAGRFYKYNVDLLLPMAAAVELLHTATLLHDDTIDSSHIRRGKLTANRLWGDASAVLVGDYLCAASARMVAETGKTWSASVRDVADPRNIRAMELLAQTIMNICSGAIEESVHPFESDTERYFQRIAKKTASLFSAATQSGALLSEAPDTAVECLKEYGHKLGMGFQIVDDILDFGSDVRRGSFTLPVILFLQRPENSRVMQILSEDKERGVKLLLEMVSGSPVVGECFQMARDFCSQACIALEQLPPNPAYNSLVNLASYIAQHEG